MTLKLETESGAYVFCNQEGIVDPEYGPQGQTVNQHLYLNYLDVTVMQFTINDQASGSLVCGRQCTACLAQFVQWFLSRYHIPHV
jgi:hypothetical protein